MATFSDARAVYGLSATGTPTSTNVSGSVVVGVGQSQVRLSTADIAYSLRAVMIGSGDAMTVDFYTGDTTGSTSFVAGTAQVETATVIAASGITGSGNATVTVTAAGMTGSPKAISVALTTTEHTTATLIATAIAAALNADTAYSALFTATSSSANVITTRKSTWTKTPDIYPTNDSTLNVAIANGTCTGITTAATSTNTTAGVATSGTKIYDGDGKDWEGVAIPTIDEINGILYEFSGSGACEVAGSGSEFETLSGGDAKSLKFSESGVFVDATYTVTASVLSDLYVTILGKAL